MQHNRCTHLIQTPVAGPQHPPASGQEHLIIPQRSIPHFCCFIFLLAGSGWQSLPLHAADNWDATFSPNATNPSFKREHEKYIYKFNTITVQIKQDHEHTW